MPGVLTSDGKVHKTSNEKIVAAVRIAVAKPPVQNLVSEWPKHISDELARQPVQSPGYFRFLERICRRQKTSNRRRASSAPFPVREELSPYQIWLSDSNSIEPIKGDVPIEVDDFLPPAPKILKTNRQLAVPRTLAEVPEVHLQEPLTKAMDITVAQLHTECTIDRIHFLNQKKPDAFIEVLVSHRRDLAGLPFVLRDDCHMKYERSRQFFAALGGIREAGAKMDAHVRAELDSKSFETTEDRLQAGAAILATKHLMYWYESQATQNEIDPGARVAALMQVVGARSGATRLGLVKYLAGLTHVDATRALAKLAIFSEESEIRSAAVGALKMRREADDTDILLEGLKYPWPAVAERSSEAIVKLERNDLVQHLIEVLERPDPRAPYAQELNGKKVSLVRELVRINHHHNCLLCHAPATSSGDGSSKEAKGVSLIAQVLRPATSSGDGSSKKRLINSPR